MKVRSLVFSVFPSFLLLLLTLGLFSARPADAQNPPPAPIIGSWGQGFDHSTVPPLGTDFTVPFQGPAGSGYQLSQNHSGFFSWGFYDAGMGHFQPVHMALIPKGPHRGRILVWDEYPVVLHPRATVDNQWWVCQSWSIIDPEASDKRFRNFLLPLQPTSLSNPQLVSIASLVCSGHAWSQNGDLVLAGGTVSVVDSTLDPWGTGTGVISGASAKFLFMFDPAAPSQGFGTLANLYGIEVGHWEKAPDLDLGRFYPTVTLSQVLTRPGVSGNEVVMVSGGSEIGTLNNHDPINTYESFIVQASTSSNFLTRDSDHPINQFWLPGPATGVGGILDEYPRFHLLSDGTMFLSGYTYLSTKTNLDLLTTGNPARFWDTTNGQTGTSWTPRRVNGASVFFARMGGLQDVVVRLGGQDGNPVAVATDTAEFCQASIPSPVPIPSWSPLTDSTGAPTTIPGGPRSGLNAVFLPDASVLVIGCENPTNNPANPRIPVLTTALYRPGIGWQIPPPSPEPRKYHSTAVLRPDGTVLVGGGNERATRDGSMGLQHLHPTLPAG